MSVPCTHFAGCALFYVTIGNPYLVWRLFLKTANQKQKKVIIIIIIIIIITITMIIKKK